MDQPQQLPDIRTLMRYVETKRRTAAQKLAHSRHMMARAEEMQREAAVDMQEIEAFERLIKSVPTTPDELNALEAEAQSFHRGLHLENMVVMGSSVIGRDTVAMGVRTQREQVAALCFQILSDGTWKTTEELLDELSKRGFALTAENKLQRLSQILSTSAGFKNQRGRGWTLDVSPPLDASSVQRDVLRRGTDEETARRARELARDDRNSAR